MAVEGLNGLLALYAASSAVSMSYVALPDYRYRNSITEYFEYYTKRTIRLSDIIKNDNIEADGIRKMVLKEKERQCSKKTVPEVSEKDRVEPWLRFLDVVHDLPRGHVPNDTIEFTDADWEKSKTTKENWFLTLSGRIFQSVYMNHNDNLWSTWLAGICLLFLSIIVGLVVFGFTSVADGMGWKTMIPFFAIGITGLVVPVGFAHFGRNIMCRHARSSLKHAVDKLLGAELDDEGSDWLTAVAQQTDVAP